MRRRYDMVGVPGFRYLEDEELENPLLVVEEFLKQQTWNYSGRNSGCFLHWPLAIRLIKLVSYMNLPGRLRFISASRAFWKWPG